MNKAHTQYGVTRKPQGEVGVCLFTTTDLRHAERELSVANQYRTSEPPWRIVERQVVVTEAYGEWTESRYIDPEPQPPRYSDDNAEAWAG